MPQTMIEKIFSAHADGDVRPGDTVDIRVDTRVARDFGGANVVKHLEDRGLGVADPSRTFFTFDCNPTGSDQKYAANQQFCRLYARRQGIRVYDIDSGIGTHVAIDTGIAWPGCTFVSTDSHANILGAIGAFGQGMGDVDIAAVWSQGKMWFRIPETVRVELQGMPPEGTTPKDVALTLLRHFGANGLLGCAAEVYGPYVDGLDLAGRVTLASLATEMGAIIIIIPPNEAVMAHARLATGRDDLQPVLADEGASYARVETIDLSALEPLVSRPGHPEDVVPLSEVRGRRVDSVFIGSCTNGRYEDIAAAAEILRDRKIAPNVVLKIVPSTDAIWRRAMADGLFDVLKRAGALISNAGCAGCAAGQVGQSGPGEIAVSTGNRNFTGKQGKGEMYLASPRVAAASAVAGCLTDPDHLDVAPKDEPLPEPASAASPSKHLASGEAADRPIVIRGRVWIIDKDNIDTDMIFHNQHLAITRIEEMGSHAFGNLEGWKDFPEKAREGDIVVTGKNFGAGSSRQQAVDCFKALAVSALVARSFGAIYERNAINAGFPIVVSDLIESGLKDGEEITIDFKAGVITRHSDGSVHQALPWSDVQAEIYRKGGLL